ncbi:MAG TPA: HEAT repeat domain-containing protein, partial [Clostridia bacterium]
MDDLNTKANICNLSKEEKYNLLNKLSDSDCITEDDLKILNILSFDEGDEIRSQVAEILENADYKDAEGILVRLLQDKDGLVRAIACDSLRYSNSIEILNLLINIIKKDRVDLVRGYAANSIANIIKNVNKEENEYVTFFEELLKKEKVKWVRINIYKSLYLLGMKSYLSKLLDVLNDRQ